MIIKENSLISSSVSIAGGAIIQQNTKIGLGAKIKNNINIGKNSQIGIGSVVVKTLRKNSSVFGNPSRPINLKKKFYDKFYFQRIQEIYSCYRYL